MVFLSGLLQRMMFTEFSWNRVTAMFGGVARRQLLPVSFSLAILCLVLMFNCFKVPNFFLYQNKQLSMNTTQTLLISK